MTIRILILLVLLCSSCATHPWDRREKVLIASHLSLQTVDYLQTKDSVFEDGTHTERNKLINSSTDLLLYKVLGNAAIIGLVRLLPHTLRKGVLIVTNAVGLTIVIQNNNEGSNL